MAIEIPDAAVRDALATFLWLTPIRQKDYPDWDAEDAMRITLQDALPYLIPAITADLRARTEKPLADVIHHSEWLIRNEQKYGDDMDNAISRLFQQALSSLVAALTGTERGDDEVQ